MGNPPWCMFCTIESYGYLDGRYIVAHLINGWLLFISRPTLSGMLIVYMDNILPIQTHSSSCGARHALQKIWASKSEPALPHPPNLQCTADVPWLQSLHVPIFLQLNLQPIATREHESCTVEVMVRFHPLQGALCEPTKQSRVSSNGSSQGVNNGSPKKLRLVCVAKRKKKKKRKLEKLVQK